MPFEAVVEVGPLKCQGCGVEIWPRCGGYWFLLLAPRGRVRFPGAQAAQAVLCSGCGRRFRESIELAGIACGESYEYKRSESRGLEQEPQSRR